MCDCYSRQWFRRNCFGKAQSLDEESSSISSLSSLSEAELEYKHKTVYHKKRKSLMQALKYFLSQHATYSQEKKLLQLNGS